MAPAAESVSGTLKESERGGGDIPSPSLPIPLGGGWVLRVPVRRPPPRLAPLFPFGSFSPRSRICFLHLPLRSVHGFRRCPECFSNIPCVTQWSLRCSVGGRVTEQRHRDGAARSVSLPWSPEAASWICGEAYLRANHENANY